MVKWNKMKYDQRCADWGGVCLCGGGGGGGGGMGGVTLPTF